MMLVRSFRSLVVMACATALLLFPIHGQAQPGPPKTPPQTPQTPPKAPPPTHAGATLTVAPTELAPRVMPTEQMLEVVGVLSLRVEKLEDAIDTLERTLPELDGKLRSRHDTHFSFKVPRARFPEAMDRTASLGVELDRSVKVRDHTPEYLDNLALLRSAQNTRNRIAGLIEGITGVEDPLQVERSLSHWDGRVSELQRAQLELQRRTEDAVILVELHPTLGAERERVPSFRLPFPWLDDISLERLLDLPSGATSNSSDDLSLKSSAQMDFHLKGYREPDEKVLGGKKTAMSAGLTLRGVGGTTPIGVAGGMDLEVGGGFSGGFLYEYRMLGGLGTGFGKHVSLGLVTGIGMGGLTGDHIPFGLDLPVEAFAAVKIDSVMSVSSWARSSWILASDDRQDGSQTAPFGDEFAAGGSILFGGGTRERIGPILHGTYRELMGTHIYEVSIGYGISFVDLGY